ncbi:MAG TPA: AMP-binding protein [Immundisolibacter sp.]|nr:AMP-binding protein [Immundisolibacter sp.]
MQIAPAPDLATLLRGLDGFGDAPALRWFAATGEQALNYRELAQRIEAAAARLQARGVSRGGRVLLLAESGLPWAVAALAVLRAGGVLLPLDAHSPDDTLQHVLADAAPVLVLTDAEHAPRCAGCGAPVLLVDALTVSDPVPAVPAGAGIDPASPAVMFYTSGTTGPPKGVPLSHANLLYQLRTVAAADLARPGDRVLLPLPMHHVYPFVIGLLLPIVAGVTLLLPGATTGAQIMQALREGRASVLIGVPRLYRALLEGIDGRVAGLPAVSRRLLGGLRAAARWCAPRLGAGVARRLLAPLHRQMAPDLRLLACGGAALEADLDAALTALGWQVAVGYGLTETSPLLTLRMPGQCRSGSAGRAVLGTELRLAVPEAGEEDLPAGAGAIEVRGPGVFGGYFNLPQANQQAFTADGWFRTGDLGRLEADGCLEVLGRASTLIVTESGKNIQPEEVEAVYQAHPLIAEAAVLQVDRRLVALLVPEPSATEAALREAVAVQSQQLPSYQRVGEFAVTAEPLARTALGKLRRHLLAQRYRQARQAPGGPPPEAAPLAAADQALLRDPRARAVWDFLRERYPDRPLTPDSHVQLDLGLDSLGWLNFGMDIAARSGAQLSEDAIARIATVRDLLREVSLADTAPPATLLDDPLAALDAQQRRWLRPMPVWLMPLRAVLLGLTWLLMRVLFRLRVTGREHLPASGPFLLAPNHGSYLDAPALGAALGRRGLRDLCWAGWTGVMLGSPLMRAVSRLARVLPMDSERRALSSLAFGLAALRAGNALVWFPEGARSKTGALEPFLPGIGLLLEHTDVPVLPVYIEGAYQAWPLHRRWPRLGRISVHIGAPIRATELLAGPGPGQPHERAARALREAVAGLIRARLAGPPAP